ncbi:MAG: GGDEF domain-containing protein [Clostridia bacterium]|nr:GGDEF domain-containing protein [Clostridia bacterium]
MLIGVLVSRLVDDYTYNVCRGIEHIALENGDKCVFIPGKYIGLDFEADFKNKYGYCFNTLYSYGALSCFDGLIIEMASVMMCADAKRQDRFAKFYENIPHVFISYDRSQFSNVTIDNKAGLDEALEYMYSNGARKFAMLGGPENNVDAQERHRVFDEFLKRNNLPAHSKNYQHGSFFLDVSDVAEQLYQDNKDADVFVCANDVTAKYIYGVLAKHDLIPGKDVSVLGFDDSDICVSTYPTISSVRTDATEVGKASYKLLKEAIQNKPARKIAVPSKFILRDSILHKQSGKKVKLDFETEYKSIIKSNIHIEDHRAALEEGERYYRTFTLLDNATEDNILDIIKNIDEITDAMFFSECMKYLDWDILVELIEKRYRKMFVTVQDVNKKGELTNSYVNFLKKIMKYSQTTDGDRSNPNTKSIYNLEAFLRDTMQYARNTETNYSKFLEGIDFLGIKNAYFYLYEAPISNMQGELFRIPPYLYLKAMLRDGVSSSIPQNSQKISKDEIFTNEFVDLDLCEKLIMFPIYSENYLYGVVVCDMRRDGYKHSELFTIQLSAAVKMLHLRMENKQILDEYEESVRKLKENNITLDTMSKTDPLTGLNNRRGFYVRIEKMRMLIPNDNVNMLLGYADMNDLKVVNDRFGHDDGDYALRSIATVLTDFVTEYQGFAARIGGDEFAFAIAIPIGADPKVLCDEVYAMLNEFNKNSKKPYNVCVSIGFCLVDKNSDISTDDALVIADEKLYVEKLEKKSVIKKI